MIMKWFWYPSELFICKFYNGTARWKGIPNGVDETHRRALSDGSSFQKEYTVLPRIFNSDFGLFFEVSNWGMQKLKNLSR